MARALFSRISLAGVALCLGGTASAQTLQLPTANRALFESGGEERFFVGTVGRTWTSGTFGCVRSEGWQVHEGLDIRCLERDAKGEPTDPVLATAEGAVAYLNARPSLSNYGRYILIRHNIDGVELLSLYAHLREIRSGLQIGQSVKAGDTIATLGRTANTREGISRERAHLHFELNLFINERFPSWYKKHFPTQRNDHGLWNGQNIVGLDPRLILLEQRAQGPKFSLARHIRTQTELCRVTVRATDFPWLKRYPQFVKPNPRASQEGVAGYEIALNFNALPFELTPRAASELSGKTKFRLLSVNEVEQRKNPGRKLVTQRNGRWELTSRGLNVLDLLTY